MKLVVTNLKGGAGKTTSSVFLAAALARSGRTLLVDADPQGSALSWSEVAEDLPFDVIGAPVKDLARRIPRIGEGYTHVVVDTPPGEGDMPIVRSALLAADVVLLPIGTSLVELDRLGPTLDLIAEAESLREFRLEVLLTRVRRGTRALRVARETLMGLGLAVLETEIPLLERYSTAFGLAPEIDDYQAVLDELMQGETR